MNISKSLLDFFKIDEEKYNKFMCLKCFTFWITLIFTLNPFTAAIASLIAYILDKFIIEEKIEL